MSCGCLLYAMFEPCMIKEGFLKGNRLLYCVLLMRDNFRLLTFSFVCAHSLLGIFYIIFFKEVQVGKVL
jgi:hypothetical protein